METKELKEKIIEIIGFMMEPDRAKCKAEEVLKLIEPELVKAKLGAALENWCNELFDCVDEGLMPTRALLALRVLLDRKIDGWVSVNDKQNPIPTNEPLEILFESGYIMDYNNKNWPIEKVTHWRIKIK
jgi:hypothetical protein